MDPVHGKHHKGRTTYQDYKQHLQKRQSDLYLQSIPTDEYCITTNGQYRCLICPHIPPFSTGQLLYNHVKGKKHLSRLFAKAESIKKVKEQQQQRQQQQQQQQQIPTSIPSTSMAMPSLLYRTHEITKRVLESNHSKDDTIQSKPVATPLTPIVSLSSSDEPEWLNIVKKEKEERNMISKGFCKNEKGEWIRDPMVEFDSDDEPTL